MEKRDIDIDELVRLARAKFDALTPEQQAAHRREQAISWVYSEMCWGLNDDREGGSPLTREEIGAMYDARGGGK